MKENKTILFNLRLTEAQRDLARVLAEEFSEGNVSKLFITSVFGESKSDEISEILTQEETAPVRTVKTKVRKKKRVKTKKTRRAKFF